MTLTPLTWQETRRRMQADDVRVRELLGRWPGGVTRFHPALQCACLYRIANHFARRGHRFTARFFWHLNFLVTGADVSEYADLDEGLALLAPLGTVIAGKAGRNLTMLACAGIGGEVGRFENIGAGLGLAVLGDDVTIEAHAGVLGPVRIGDRVRIPAGVVVTRDIPADGIVQGPPMRILRPPEVA